MDFSLASDAYGDIQITANPCKGCKKELEDEVTALEIKVDNLESKIDDLI